MSIDMIRLTALLLMLALTIFFDVRFRRIPNTIVVSLALFALGSSAWPGSLGFMQSLGGFAFAFAIFLPLYALRTMGAGDVKLMAACGAFLGVNATAVAVLATLVSGGILALIYSARAHSLGRTLNNIKCFFFSSAAQISGGGLPRVRDLAVSGERMPYSLAITAGVAVCLAARFYYTGTFS